MIAVLQHQQEHFHTELHKREVQINELKVQMMEALIAVWEDCATPDEPYLEISESVKAAFEANGVDLKDAATCILHSFERRLKAGGSPSFLKLLERGGCMWRAYMDFRGMCLASSLGVDDISDSLGPAPEGSIWSSPNVYWKGECYIETGRRGYVSAPGEDGLNLR